MIIIEIEIKWNGMEYIHLFSRLYCTPHTCKVAEKLKNNDNKTLVNEQHVKQKDFSMKWKKDEKHYTYVRMLSMPKTKVFVKNNDQ